MSAFEKKDKRGFAILQPRPGDAAGILSVLKNTWLATYPNEEYGITEQDILSKGWDDPDRLAGWQKRIAESGDATQMWIAKEGGTVVGFCDATKGCDQNRVRSLYVPPDYQRQGIGRQLIEKAFDWLGDDKGATVAVAKYNVNAIEFYRKAGFEGEREGSVSPAGRLPSGRVIPEIEMVRLHRER